MAEGWAENRKPGHHMLFQKTWGSGMKQLWGKFEAGLDSVKCFLYSLETWLSYGSLQERQARPFGSAGVCGFMFTWPFCCSCTTQGFSLDWFRALVGLWFWANHHLHQGLWLFLPPPCLLSLCSLSFNMLWLWNIGKKDEENYYCDCRYSCIDT